MKTTIRKMGNLQGVILPKPLLAQVGLEDEAEMVVEDHAIVIRRPRGAIREGWAEASRRSPLPAMMGSWPECGNEDDTHLQW